MTPNQEDQTTVTDTEKNPVYLVTDEQGSPLGVFDADEITTEGTRLAFAMAAVCDDEQELLRVQEETLTRVGSSAYGYVCANAIATMAQCILAPTFEITREYGWNVQRAMAAIARGEDPTEEKQS